MAAILATVFLNACATKDMSDKTALDITKIILTLDKNNENK